MSNVTKVCRRDFSVGARRLRGVVFPRLETIRRHRHDRNQERRLATTTTTTTVIVEIPKFRYPVMYVQMSPLEGTISAMKV